MTSYYYQLTETQHQSVSVSGFAVTEIDMLSDLKLPGLFVTINFRHLHHRCWNRLMLIVHKVCMDFVSHIFFCNLHRV